MKIVVIGTRGIPDIQGGVETHCEQLYPRIATMGHDVTVIRRSCYVTADNRRNEYHGVKLIDLYAPRRKSLEAILHTTLAMIKAATMRPDVVHVHAIGPALLVPFGRMMGLKVVMTNHGPDYDRAKWGGLARRILRTGERFGTRWSNAVIVISRTIAGILDREYGRRDTDLIYNGVMKPDIIREDDMLVRYGLKKGGYILAVGRLVEEKGFHDLITAWRKSGRTDIPLVIAGDADHEDDYSRRLKSMAAEAGVIMTGFVKGSPLAQLYANARLFVLPSYHEGLPIVLLEAMSYRLDALTSDIPANMLSQLNDEDHFVTGDTGSLCEALRRKLATGNAGSRRYDLSDYDWDVIARRTVEVYEKVLNR